MAERRKSLQQEPTAPRANKRRRTMMDSISEVAKWILPSWASEGGTETVGPSSNIQEPSSSGIITNGEPGAKRSRLNEVPRREPIGRLSPVGVAVTSSASSASPEPDFDDGSDSSTSGCSSLSAAAGVPILGTSGDKRGEDKFVQRRQRPIQNTKEAKTREVSTTVDQTSIVAETSITASPSVSFSLYSRPSRALSSTLNATLPLASSGSRSLSSSLQKPERSLNRSIFYNGKTTYGGASAHRKLNLFTSSPYQMAPKRAKTTSNVTVPESSAAKRLIEVLERMKTPVQNAKRIPLGKQDFGSSHNSEARRKEALETIASLRQNPPPALSTCRSSVAPARIGSNVKPPPASEYAIDIDESEAVPSSAPDFSVITSTPRATCNLQDMGNDKGGGGKMKSSKTLQQQSHRKVNIEEEPSPSIVTDFPVTSLPIKILPNFSFAPKSVYSQEVPKNSSVRSPLTSLADFSNKPFEKPVPPVCASESPEVFTFAEPVSLDKPMKEMLNCKEEFRFKDPLYLNKDSLKGGFTIAAPTIYLDSPTVVLKMKDTTKPTPAPVQLSTGSVMDVLGGVGAKDNQKAIISVTGDSWECSTCTITNKADVTSCKVCETKKPEASTSVSASTTSTSNSWGNLFKKEAGSWTCDMCLVLNKPDAQNCVACEKLKPGVKVVAPPSTDPKQSTGANLWDQFKTPVGQWSCSTCLISNKADTIKCIACETPKPGEKPNPTTSAPPLVSSLSSKFKMEPGWSCNTCMVRNKLDDLKCLSCETPKPGSAVSSTTTNSTPAVASAFKFGVPSVSANNNERKQDADVSVVNVFGNDTNVCKDTLKPASAPVNGFKFGVADTSVVQPDTTKLDNTLSQPSKSVVNSSRFAFGASTSTIETGKTTAETTSGTSGFGGFKFEVPSNTTKKESDTEKTATSASGSSVFSFGNSAVESTAVSNLPEPSTKAFSFAAPTSAAPITSAPTFAFGSTPTSTVATSTAPTSTALTFSFGAAPASSVANGNIFGASATTSVTSTFGSSTTVTTSTSTQPTASSGFSFAAPTASAVPLSTTETKAAPAPLFTFGAPPSTTSKAATASAFVFGTAPSGVSSPTTGFNFGSPANAALSGVTSTTFGFGQSAGSASVGAFPAAPISTTASSTTPHMFGSSTTTTPVFGGASTGSAFQFTANAATAPASATPAVSSSFVFQPPAPASGGMFTFGANANNAAPAANSTPAPATPFQFGSAAAVATPPVNDMFNFGAAGATPVGNFAFGGTAPGANASPFQFSNSVPSAAPGINPFPNAENPFNAATTQGRKVKRAVRRKGR